MPRAFISSNRNVMSEKLTFTQRAERLAEAAGALRDIGSDLAWIADAWSPRPRQWLRYASSRRSALS